MLPRIVVRGADAVRRLSGIAPRIEKHSLLGRPLDVVQDSVRLRPDYDDAWFVACARRSESIFDVGANSGYTAVLAMLCPGVREVVLFEPSPDALLIAAQNLIRNQLCARARFVCAFVSDRGGETAQFWTVGAGAAGSMYAGHALTASRAGSSIDVPTITLDEACDAYATEPDLVKIDVEGAEAQVLGGARKLAARGRTRFLVEMHSNPELTMAANAATALSWCDASGYAAWYLARHARLSEPEQIQARGRCHLLLQPADWPYPSWLTDIGQSASLPDGPLAERPRT